MLPLAVYLICIYNSRTSPGCLLQEYMVPDEYVKIMSQSMLNKCPVSSYDQVCEVVKKELGGAPEEVSAIIVIKWPLKLI